MEVHKHKECSVKTHLHTITFCPSNMFAVTSGLFSCLENTKTLKRSFSTKMLQHHLLFLRALTQNPTAMFLLLLLSSFKYQSKISKNEDCTGVHCRIVHWVPFTNTEKSNGKDPENHKLCALPVVRHSSLVFLIGFAHAHSGI